MFSIHIFFVIVATIILVIFAEFQKLRKITWVLVVGCIGYIILNIEPNIPIDVEEQNKPVVTSTIQNTDTAQIAEVVIKNSPIPVTIITDTTVTTEIALDTLRMSVNSIEIAKEVSDREPVDVSKLFLNDIEHLYCYTSVNNPIEGNIVVHHWYSNNIEYFNYPIEVGNSDNWRCWSMITIRPQLAGEWMVSATDTLGNLLAQTEFTILDTEE